MSAAGEQFKINLHQNLWGAILGLSATGVAERYALTTLYYLGLVVSIVMLISLLFTTYAYTKNYMGNKQSRSAFQ